MIDSSPPPVSLPPVSDDQGPSNGLSASPLTDGTEPPNQPLSARNQSKAHSLGLTSATGLVIGSIVGTGVFTMPAVLAGAGTMGIVVLSVIAVGAMLLAVLFGQLTKRVPNSDGGLYAYARHEFGDFAGYLVGWCYWIQSWAGNEASSRRGSSMWTPSSASTTSPASSTGASPWWGCGSRRPSTWWASVRWPGSRM
jgi:amino acid transporter